MPQKTAVVLFNLGGPDRPESIKPFLYNFFMDPMIIRVMLPIRWVLAKAISSRRSGYAEKNIYSAMGGKTPLLENTQIQAKALEKELLKTRKNDSEHKVFVCMRYWHPMAEQVTREVKKYKPDKIVLIPLYPQFSTTTTKSSLSAWYKAARETGLDIQTSAICCYPVEKGFIEASARLLKNTYIEAIQDTGNKQHSMPRILFSAHGLPESVIKNGDPYQWQCEKTAEAIVEDLKISALDWVVCYQSRIGPKKWIGPSVEEELEKAARDRVPVIVCTHSFVSEHAETLVEIDIKYRKFAEENNIPYFLRVPTVGVEEEFISGLAKIIKNSTGQQTVCSNLGNRVCHEKFGECGAKSEKNAKYGT